MHTDAFNHHPGQLLLFTGAQQFGRPTMGAWTVYGLGSESQNLPGFVVLGFRRRHQRRSVELLERLSAFRVPGDAVSAVPAIRFCISAIPPAFRRSSSAATLDAFAI